MFAGSVTCAPALQFSRRVAARNACVYLARIAGNPPTRSDAPPPAAMNGSLARRVVTRLPLARLWDASDFLPHVRERTLYDDAAAEQVRAGHARIAIAELGEPLRWLPYGQARAFWKHEIEPRLLPPGTPLRPGAGYGYAASLWTAQGMRPTLLLEVRSADD